MVPDLRELPAGCRFRDRCALAEGRCAVKEPPLIVVGEVVELHKKLHWFKPGEEIK